MGMGEPLANYKRVIEAVRTMVAPQPHGLGMSARGITVSTVGLVPAIKKLADEDIPLTFALSLHAPDDELRDELIPVNSRWKADEAIDAAYEYYAKTGRRVSIEYALIKDMNDHAWRADLLAEKLNARGKGWCTSTRSRSTRRPARSGPRRSPTCRTSSSAGSTRPASRRRCVTPAARRSTAPAVSWLRPSRRAVGSPVAVPPGRSVPDGGAVRVSHRASRRSRPRS